MYSDHAFCVFAKEVFTLTMWLLQVTILSALEFHRYARSKYVLNEAPNRNDAMGVENNVRLTTMGAKQFSRVAV